MNGLGLLALGCIGAALPMGALPEEPVAGIFLILGVLWVETASFATGRYHRFTPTSPLILAASLSPSFGIVTCTILLLLLALSQKEDPILGALGQRVALATGLLASAAGGFLSSDFLLRTLIVVLIYVLVRIIHLNTLARRKSVEDRALWRQLLLRIQPLELALAALVLPFAYLTHTYPYLTFLTLPILKSLPLAVENIVLSSQNKMVAQALTSLRRSRAREKQVVRKLRQTKRERDLLENFADHLSQQPSLLGTARQTVETVRGLLQVDNVIIFLSDPPEPFYYQVEEQLLAQVQAHSLLELTEPAVLKAFRAGRTVVSEESSVEERLLSSNSLVGAFPLGEQGVLCIGLNEPLSGEERKQLEWLAEKAALALKVAHEAHLKRLRERESHQQVRQLTTKVENLSVLVTHAKEMASTLQPGELRKRFFRLVRDTVAHDGGLFQERGGTRVTWGLEIQVPPSIRNQVIERKGGIVISDSNRLSLMCESSLKGAVVVALDSSGTTNAVLAVASRSHPYSADTRDNLFLLASQASLAFSNARLYQEVVDARIALEKSQEQLIQSSKMTAMGQLSAGVAHELNSPIGAVSICLDESLELLDNNPELVSRLLRKGQKGVERARVIIDRLLSYCCEWTDREADVELTALLHDTIDFLSFRLKDVQLSLQGLEQNEPVVVRGDENSLQQVFTSLLTNAVDAVRECSSTEGRVKVALEKREQCAVIVIEDNGEGIPEAHLGRVFEPFFTTKEPGDGTGLGLWAAHQIVERHEGTIDVHSRPNEGAIFSVTLPLNSA